MPKAKFNGATTFKLEGWLANFHVGDHDYQDLARLFWLRRWEEEVLRHTTFTGVCYGGCSVSCPKEDLEFFSLLFALKILPQGLKALPICARQDHLAYRNGRFFIA